MVPMRDECFRTPLSLPGTRVELVPIDRGQIDALRAAAHNPQVYRLMRHGPGESRADIESLLDYLFERQRSGTDLPFTVRTVPEHRVIGMTRYLRIDRPNDAVEIGGTWLDSDYWHTPCNTEAKYLLFRHAFEREGAHRVSLQTDARNERSQRAIERLGARKEGVLRDDALLENGSYRSSVYYSVLAPEWPSVRSRLESFLARAWNAAAPTQGSP
jgi:N-acetyltransferase